jgi:hypothetical protein
MKKPSRVALPKPRAGGNLGVVFGCLAFAGACGAFPLWSTMKMREKGVNLMHTEQHLTGSQIQRGSFMNAGSKDMGADPDWNQKDGTWRGKRVDIQG